MPLHWWHRFLYIFEHSVVLNFLFSKEKENSRRVGVVSTVGTRKSKLMFGTRTLRDFTRILGRNMHGLTSMSSQVPMQRLKLEHLHNMSLYMFQHVNQWYDLYKHDEFRLHVILVGVVRRRRELAPWLSSLPAPAPRDRVPAADDPRLLGDVQ